MKLILNGGENQNKFTHQPHYTQGIARTDHFMPALTI